MFNLNYIPWCLHAKDPQERSANLNSWFWSWHIIAFMHCLLNYDVSDSFYKYSLCMLSYIIWNYIDTLQLNMKRSELLIILTTCVLFSFWIFVSFWGTAACLLCFCINDKCQQGITCLSKEKLIKLDFLLLGQEGFLMLQVN